MNKVKFLILGLAAGSLMVSCSKSADPTASSNVSLSLSAATTNGKTTIGGRTASTISLTDVKVSLRDIQFDFDHEDDHFKMKKDSAFSNEEDHEAKLKGPFIVDLLDAGAFIDQVVTTVDIPNGKYEKVSFKLWPSTESGDMHGKSFLIRGTIGTTPFEFWSGTRARFGAKFRDSTSMATSGAAIKLAIHLEMDKILAVANGGVDLSIAKDGNLDGTITIDPLNTDGNKDLEEAILKLLVRRSYCQKDKH